MGIPTPSRRTVLALAATSAIGIAVAFTGSSAARPGSAANAAANPLAKYGNVTLNVWSADNQDPGPKPVIEEISKQFEKKYPNVKVKLTFKGFTDYMKVINLALNGNNAPDVAEGNQGYGTDALLVRAKLIRPLDGYAKKYGWGKYYSTGAAAQFRWTPDGKTFGKGNLWGVGQFGQSTGVFVNAARLKKLGISTVHPKTFAEFDALVAKVRSKLPKSEPVITLGNKDGYEIVHAWGMIQGAYVTGKSVRDWIFHAPGATFDTPGNAKALAVLKRWVDAGVFGTDYNAVGENDAAAAFAKGKGVFYMGGNWQAAVLKAGLGSGLEFYNGPAGASGKHVAIGSTSLPWHISSKTKNADIAAAYIDFLINAKSGSAKLMYAQNQIPAISTAPKAVGDPYLSSIAGGWQQLVKQDGLTLFPDWTTDTMYTTLGTEFQKFAGGKESAADVIKHVQSDWEKFDKKLK